MSEIWVMPRKLHFSGITLFLSKINTSIILLLVLNRGWQRQIIILKLVIEIRFRKEFMTRGFGYSLPCGPLISSAILPLEKMPLTNVLVRPWENIQNQLTIGLKTNTISPSHQKQPSNCTVLGDEYASRKVQMPHMHVPRRSCRLICIFTFYINSTKRETLVSLQFRTGVQDPPVFTLQSFVFGAAYVRIVCDSMPCMSTWYHCFREKETFP